MAKYQEIQSSVSVNLPVRRISCGMFEGYGVSDLSEALVEIARNKMKICFI